MAFSNGSFSAFNCMLIGWLLLAFGNALADPEEEPLKMEPIEVIGVTPLHGVGLPKNKVPANIQTATHTESETIFFSIRMHLMTRAKRLKLMMTMRTDSTPQITQVKPAKVLTVRPYKQPSPIRSSTVKTSLSPVLASTAAVPCLTPKRNWRV